MNPQKRPLVNVWGFFAATYLGSWLLWGLAAIVSPAGQPNLLLVVAGVAVPSIMGIAFTYLTKDRADRRDFCRARCPPASTRSIWSSSWHWPQSW